MMKKNIVETIETINNIREHIINETELDGNCLDIFDNEEEIKELLGRLDDTERAERMKSVLASSDMIGAATRLKIVLDNKTRRRKIVRVIGAASIAAALMVASMLVYNQSNVENVQKSITVLAENQNYTHPTLITQTGEEINLNTIDDNIETSNFYLKKEDYKLEYTSKQQDIIAYNELIIPAGNRYTIKLDDGTEVTLNAGSSLRYPIKFGDTTRNVEFSGEAYFKVSKSNKPFIVKINNAYVKVYGTRFNINTQQKESIKVVLIEGSVGIGEINADNEIKMKPNQLANYNTVTNRSEIRVVACEDYISWLDDIFLYKERDLKSVLSDITAWYGVDFEINKEYCDILMTFRMSRKTKIEEMIEMLELATDVKFEKLNKTKYIMR